MQITVQMFGISKIFLMVLKVSYTKYSEIVKQFKFAIHFYLLYIVKMHFIPVMAKLKFQAVTITTFLIILICT